MPIVLYLSALGVLAVGGFVGFVYKGMHELDGAADEAEARAYGLAFLLAERQGEHFAFTLSEGETKEGFVVSVDDTASVLFLNTQRAELNDKTNTVTPKGKFVPMDMVAVALQDVVQVTGYGALQRNAEHDAEEYEEDESDDYVPEYGDD